MARKSGSKKNKAQVVSSKTVYRGPVFSITTDYVREPGIDKPLRREVEINGEPHVVVISPQGLKLTVKGKRLGHEISWQDLVRGNAALATAPNASVDATDE